MKLIALFIFLSFGAFAQDGYHAIEKSECQTESCLIVRGEVQIGFYTYRDMHGFEGRELNTDSVLTDTVYEKAELCYRGELQGLKEILLALAGNNNAEYSNGGHALVTSLDVQEHNGDFGVLIDVRSDYGNYKISKVIPGCP